MLTLKMLKDMKPGTFATGLIEDSPEGINMSNSGKLLRWVATRGQIHDWAIYAHLAEHDAEYVKDYGDKVTNRQNIRKLVECDDEALEMYRD